MPDGILGKSQSPSGSLPHTWSGKRITNPNMALKNDTRGFLPMTEAKKRPETYKLFH